MNRILVLRFSAMGDVALTLPVVKNILAHNSDCEIIFVTKKPFAVFFQHIERLTVVGIDFKKKYGGVLGLLQLKNDLLKNYDFDTVIDLHDVLRTKVLRTYFKLSGKHIIVFDKGRDEKEAAIKTKIRTPLPHTTQRYFDAFNKCITVSDTSFVYPHIICDDSSLKNSLSFFTAHCQTKNMGIAPFAKHATKTYPFDLLCQLIEAVPSDTGIFIFGGKEDSEQMQLLQQRFPHIVLTSSLNLIEQIALMSHLSVFLSMDSSNMHLAALQGVRTVSLWGGTLPHLGFAAINTLPQDLLFTDTKLTCQPCSVFGNTPCSNTKQPYACFTTIDIVKIMDRLRL